MDGLGNPIYFQLTGGNIHDATVAVEVLSHLDISDSTILADKAYGTNEILDYIQQQDGDYAMGLSLILCKVKNVLQNRKNNSWAAASLFAAAVFTS